MSPTISAKTLLAIDEVKNDVASLRALTMTERVQVLRAVCRAAGRLERSRLANGMSPSQPVPWPESTWEFLRKAAHHAQ